MRIFESCLVLVFIMPRITLAGAVPVPPDPPPPTVIKIKTGSAQARLSDEEKLRQALQRLAALGPDAALQMQMQDRPGMLQMLTAILPPWASLVPLPILLHVNFKDDDDLITRSQKFLRLGLLIRDMYLDYPLMHALGTADTSLERRLSDDLRHMLAGEAFAMAAAVLQDWRPPPEAEDDYWLSLAQLEYWSLYQLSPVPYRGHEAFVLATRALEDATRAQQALQQNHAGWTRQINEIRTYAQSVIAQVIGPVLFLAMTYLQSSKSMKSV